MFCLHIALYGAVMNKILNIEQGIFHSSMQEEQESFN